MKDKDPNFEKFSHFCCALVAQDNSYKGNWCPLDDIKVKTTCLQLNKIICRGCENLSGKVFKCSH